MKFKKLDKLNGAVVERMRASLGPDCDILTENVNEGFAELWECDEGAAYMITRIDYDHLVVCAFEGKSLKDACPYLIAAAKKQGLSAVRFHTARSALARMLKQYNPTLLEYVYKVDVNG